MNRIIIVMASLCLTMFAHSAGVTAHFALDCRTGTRTAAKIETITYSTDWVDGASEGATAVVAVNGETLSEQSGSGTVQWTPERDGTYELTHTVMVGGSSVGETLTAIFVVEGLNPDPPAISPESGTTFDTTLTVSMTCASEGATIHYTVDGSEPTMASPVYSKKFRIYGKTVIKAIAFYANGRGSEMAVAEYALGTCAQPTIQYEGGTSFGHAGIMVTCGWNEDDGVLRYTTDGSDPTSASAAYEGPLHLTDTTELRVKVFSDMYFDSEVVSKTFTLIEKPLPPGMEPASGTVFSGEHSVIITNATPGATIYYTTDGTEPTTGSTRYLQPFSITKRTVVKAIAAGRYASEMTVAEYALGRCENPVITPNDGTVFYHPGLSVTISWSGEDGVLRYTTDGSKPTTASAVYAGPFTIDETTTVKAKAFGDQYFDSGITTSRLMRVWMKLATPVVTAESSFTGTKNKVAISCTDEGATIYYTLDGSEPTTASLKYEKPFCVGESCTVKAKAVQYDYLDSDVAAKAMTREWSIGDTMGKPDHAFATSGDKGFVRVDDLTAALGESMKSGAISDNQKSVLSTTVVGPGTLSFKWKTSCEEDYPLHEWDRAEFKVDGDIKGVLDGKTDWIAVSTRIEGDGEHTVTWTYVKDDTEYEGEDCLWVSEYVWESDYFTTQTTQVPVPYLWLESTCTDVVDEFASYEKVAKRTAYNKRLTVEQCYVAGVDPESTTNDFKTVVTMENGVPVITWDPDLGIQRTYKVWGSENLHNWQCPTNSTHHFFKVTVEMP